MWLRGQSQHREHSGATAGLSGWGEDTDLHRPGKRDVRLLSESYSFKGRGPESTWVQKT